MMEDLSISTQNITNTEGGQYHALFIAIDCYKHNIPSLRCAVNDAEAFKNVLETKYTFNGNIKLLSNKEANLVSIEKALRDLKNICKKEDSLLVYFAGHGHYDDIDRKGCIVPYDGNLNYEGCLSYYDMNRHLSNIKCQNIALILDCCNAGQVFEEFTRNGKVESDSFFIFVASRKNEYANEGIDNSPFTGSIVKFLRANKGEKIIISELGSYIQRAFYDERYREYQQRPVFNYKDPTYKGDGFIFLSRNSEKNAWEKALDENTLESYTSFEILFPESEYPVKEKVTLIENQTKQWKLFIDDSLNSLQHFINSFIDGQKNYLEEAKSLTSKIEEIYEKINKKQIIEQAYRELTSQSPSIEDLQNFCTKYSNDIEAEKHVLTVKERIDWLDKRAKAEQDWEDRKPKISRETKPAILRDLCQSYLEVHYSNTSTEIRERAKQLIEDAQAFILAQEQDNYDAYLENWKKSGRFVKEAFTKKQEQEASESQKRDEKQREIEKVKLNDILEEKDYKKLIDFIETDPLIKVEALESLESWENCVKQKFANISKDSSITQLENFIDDNADFPEAEEVRNWIDELDFEDYTAAETARDINLLELYLARFSKGKYRNSARNLISEIRQEVIENSKKIELATAIPLDKNEASESLEIPEYDSGLDDIEKPSSTDIKDVKEDKTIQDIDQDIPSNEIKANGTLEPEANEKPHLGLTTEIEDSKEVKSNDELEVDGDKSPSSELSTNDDNVSLGGQILPSNQPPDTKIIRNEEVPLNSPKSTRVNTETVFLISMLVVLFGLLYVIYLNR